MAVGWTRCSAVRASARDSLRRERLRRSTRRVAVALLATGVMVMQWCDGSGHHGSRLYYLGDAVAIAAFGVLALAARVWLFMRPDFLVAPARGCDGVLRRSATPSDPTSTGDDPHL